jgi:hypothetical protein
MTEDLLQAEIFQYYHNEYCTKFNDLQHIIFAVPNGAHVSKQQAMKLKATGLVAGVSDLIVIQPNRCIFFELKLEKGKQSDKQIDFEKKVKALGFEYYVVRSLDEFKSHLI